jgi:hypothetical protein
MGNPAVKSSEFKIKAIKYSEYDYQYLAQKTKHPLNSKMTALFIGMVY